MNSLSKEDKNKIRKGDNEPLGRLFQKHYKYCVKALSNMERCSSLEAEDTFMDALQVLRDKVLSGGFDHDNLRGFLLVTAKNKLLNKQKRDRRIIDLDVDEVESYLHKQKSIHDPFESSLSQDQERRVNLILKARKELGASCQKLLHMNFDLGYKLKELTAILDFTSYDSIKSTKSRCLRTLKKKVAELMQSNNK